MHTIKTLPNWREFMSTTKKKGKKEEKNFFKKMNVGKSTSMDITLGDSPAFMRTSAIPSVVKSFHGQSVKLHITKRQHGFVGEINKAPGRTFNISSQIFKYPECYPELIEAIQVQEALPA